LSVIEAVEVLSGDGLELSTLERFDLRLGPSQAELAPDALLMEEAYGLGMLGWWLQSGSMNSPRAPGERLSRVERLHVRADVAEAGAP
jgi:hypothetical protein